LASAADRRRAQRRLAKEIKDRQFKPSPVGRRARRAATELEERRRNKPGPDSPPGGELDNLRSRVKEHKRGLWGDYVKYRPNDRIVDDSVEFRAMREFLQMDDAQAADLLSRFASAMKRNGLEEAIEEFGADWSFLFYH
jgi:hypothetical protein